MIRLVPNEMLHLNVDLSLQHSVRLVYYIFYILVMSSKTCKVFLDKLRHMNIQSDVFLIRVAIKVNVECSVYVPRPKAKCQACYNHFAFGEPNEPSVVS